MTLFFGRYPQLAFRL